MINLFIKLVSQEHFLAFIECYLWCWAPNGFGYLHGQVIDGIPCYGRSENNDICIRGECRASVVNFSIMGGEVMSFLFKYFLYFFQYFLWS